MRAVLALLPALFAAAFGLTGTVMADETVIDETSAVLANKPWPLGIPANGRDLTVSHECVRCHGHDGRAGQDDRPNLAGQNREYLIKQLIDFQANADNSFWPVRIQRLMSPHAKGLSPQQISDVAAYFSSLDCRGSRYKPISEPVKPEVAVRCESCHGKNGASPISPSIPRLAGQNRAYLIHQIDLFKNHVHGVQAGSEATRGHLIMDPQARPLTSSEVEQLAAYFSSRHCW